MGPLRIGQKLTAHGGIVDTAGSQLLFNEVRIGKTAYAADGACGIFFDFVSKRQETSFLSKIGVISRGDCIAQAGMVGQSDVEAVDPCMFKKGD